MNLAGGYNGFSFGRKGVLSIKFINNPELPDYVYCPGSIYPLSKIQTKSLQKITKKKTVIKGIHILLFYFVLYNKKKFDFVLYNK